MTNDRTKRDEAVVARLRVEVRIAEADAAFVNGATLPVVSMMVAIIVAAVILTDQQVEAALLLAGTTAVLAASGFVALRLRPGRAQRVVAAEMRLERYMETGTEEPVTKKPRVAGVRTAAIGVLVSLSLALVGRIAMRG